MAEQTPPSFEDGMMRMRLEALDDSMAEVRRTLYGISQEKNGGGLYGVVSRHTRQLDEIEHRIARPAGWTTLIIVGGVTSLALHIIQLAALITMLSMVLNR